MVRTPDQVVEMADALDDRREISNQLRPESAERVLMCEPRQQVTVKEDADRHAAFILSNKHGFIDAYWQGLAAKVRGDSSVSQQVVCNAMTTIRLVYVDKVFLQIRQHQ